MKHFTFLIWITFPFLIWGQWDKKTQFGFYATAEMPQRTSMPRMSTNLGMGLQFGYKPIIRAPIFFEFKGHIGQYNSKNEPTTYFFEDGNSTFTEVAYRSNMHRLQLGAKTYFTPYERTLRGYITPQIGVNFMKSKIRIADPNDIDDCHPLDNRVVHRSSVWTYGGELGLEIDMNQLISKRSVPNSRLYISTSFISGFRAINYINTRYMENFEHGVHDHDNHMNHDADGRPLTTTFINVTNGSTHEHKIAEIYRTPLRLFTINIGYIWYF